LEAQSEKDKTDTQTQMKQLCDGYNIPAESRAA
jgi:hypothetical protein